MGRRALEHKTLVTTAGIASMPLLIIPKKPKGLILGHNSHQFKLDVNWGHLYPLRWPTGKGNAAGHWMDEIIIK